jgi:hypothetical protein
MRLRRTILRLGLALLVLCALVGYFFLETRTLTVHHERVCLPGLPRAFRGMRAVVISDVHHGIFFPVSFVREIVRHSNSLKPDLVLLLGDYAYQESRYLQASLYELGALEALEGRIAILGNHDILLGRQIASTELARQHFIELTNRNICLQRGEDRLVIAGVDDLQQGHPDMEKALEGTRADDFVILLSHIPDVIETVRDPRIHFVLSGHTHGGQIHLPFVGSPIVPSAYGQKYRAGFVRGPSVSGYVSTGAGAAFPPIRIGCPASITLMTFDEG